jgi:hypothetical protein
VVEQVNEELGLYWAQTTLLSLPAEEDSEDLGESFERGDDLLVYIAVLRGRLEDRYVSPKTPSFWRCASVPRWGRSRRSS